MPAWLTSDWPLIGITVLMVVGCLATVSAVYGMILVLVATGEPGALLSGAGVGAFLGFVSFGVQTVAAASGGDHAASFAARYLPLLYVALPVAATWFGMRFAFSRLTDPDEYRRLAFVAKLALSLAVLMSILAAVLTFDNREAETFFSKVSAATAFSYPLLIVLATGAVYLSRHGGGLVRSRFPETPWLPSLAPALDGVKAFALLAAGMAVLSTVGALVVADRMVDRVLLLLTAPFHLANVGVAGAVVAMGGSVGLSPIGGTEGAGSRHLSLLNFGFPPTQDAGAAPFFWFALLAAAPLLVGWLVWRRLEATKPASEQEALGPAFVAAFAFTLVSWIASLLARTQVYANAEGLERGDSTLILHPSSGAAFGLALLWATAGAVVAALVWSRRRHLAWDAGAGSGAGSGSDSGADAPAPPAGPTPATPPATPPATLAGTKSCLTCGASLEETNRFCPSCGTAVPPD